MFAHYWVLRFSVFANETFSDELELVNVFYIVKYPYQPIKSCVFSSSNIELDSQVDIIICNCCFFLPRSVFRRPPPNPHHRTSTAQEYIPTARPTSDGQNGRGTDTTWKLVYNWVWWISSLIRFASRSGRAPLRWQQCLLSVVNKTVHPTPEFSNFVSTTKSRDAWFRFWIIKHHTGRITPQTSHCQHNAYT